LKLQSICPTASLALLFLAWPSLPACAQTAPLYEITGERSRVESDRLTDGPSKAYPFKFEGGGVRPELVYDERLQSHVLVFRTASTPAGARKDRSELSLYSGVEYNRPWALGMKAFIAPDSTFPKTWQSIVQCPQAGGGGTPVFSLSLSSPDRFLLVARNSERPYRAFATGQLPVGRWFDMELELTLGEKGFARLWVDGRVVAEGEAVLRYKGDAGRCTLKIGIYRGSEPEPFELRVDDVRFGTDRESVRAR
jgi:hypothetical protein